ADLTAFVEQHAPKISLSNLQRVDASPEKIVTKPQAPVLDNRMPTYKNIVHARISSYTSLLQQEQALHFNVTSPSQKVAEKSVHTLPAGSAIGNVLHTLLEKIPLETVRKACSPQDLLPWVADHQKEGEFSAWQSIFAE